MRCYLLAANQEQIKEGNFSFNVNARYAERLIKDVGLYGVYYLLYNRSEEKIVQKGSIHHIDYYENKNKYEAFFEDEQLLNHPLDMEIKESYDILPLNMADIKKIGLEI